MSHLSDSCIQNLMEALLIVCNGADRTFLNDGNIVCLHGWVQ